MINLLKVFLDFDQSKLNEFVTKNSKKYPSGTSVLDVGAGSGPYRDTILQFGFVYTSQDFSQLDESLIRERANAPVHIVSYATKILVPDEKYGVILCTEVLEYVPDPLAVIKEMTRLLKKGVEMIVTIPRISLAHQLPYCFVSGYHEPWFNNASEINGFTVLHMDYPASGYLNLFKLAITGATFSLKLKGQAALIRKVLSLSLFLIYILTSYFICILLDRLDTDKPFGYGLHVLMKK